ncbi:TetR/AcrR family transcriptional regulator C-terminal domain-containing protein [Nocardia sp. NPDC088792]|uniref:TetR/AcrR family transcriptional regulator C-terminal domain-containing protein n=1 Tax=Nocardia sp. NPDC088792 TaxID=3364332 RepID=UPI0038068D08
MSAKTQEFSSVWTRPQRQRRDQPALSRDQIVTEALTLLDTEGIDALSMRKLGSRLNAGATSLYTHVTNKDEILELVVDAAFGEPRVPEDTTRDSWRADMTALAREIRATLLRHPWMLSVMTGAGLAYLGPNLMRVSEAMLGIFEKAGFDDDASDRATNAIFAYIIGSTSTEAAMLNAVTHSGLTEQEWFGEMMAAAEHASKPYPRMHRRYVTQRDLDTEQAREDFFGQELGLILDGLEVRGRTKKPAAQA